MADFNPPLKEINDNHLHLVVKVLSNTFWLGKALTFQKRVILLKKASRGDLDDLIVDIDCVDIVNLHEVNDGLYVLQTCNETKDYETGVIDDYDLKLVPYAGE